VVSSLHRDGSPVADDLRWGVYVVFEAPNDYAMRCFAEYGVATDPSGRRAALYRPFHLIGLELNVSVLSAALRREPTGAPDAWRADVAATAKRDLRQGELLDGEGGSTVWGKLLPASASRALGALPIGLASRIPLTRAVRAGEVVTWRDVQLDERDDALSFRREMELRFAA